MKPAFEPDLFRARFALLKRNDHLTPAEQRRLDRLFDDHPRLQVAWDALQELYGLYQADDLEGALEALERFTNLYQTGQIPEYHSIVDTILKLVNRDPRLAPQPTLQRTPLKASTT